MREEFSEVNQAESDLNALTRDVAMVLCVEEFEVLPVFVSCSDEENTAFFKDFLYGKLRQAVRESVDERFFEGDSDSLFVMPRVEDENFLNSVKAKLAV